MDWYTQSGSFECKHGKHWIVLLNHRGSGHDAIEVHRSCNYREHWRVMHASRAVLGMTRLVAA